MKSDSIRRHKPPDPVSTKRGQAHCACSLVSSAIPRNPATGIRLPKVQGNEPSSATARHSLGVLRRVFDYAVQDGRGGPAGHSILTTVRPSLTHVPIRSWLVHNASHAAPCPRRPPGRTAATTAPSSSSLSWSSPSFADQTRGHRRLDVPARGLTIHPRPLPGRAQTPDRPQPTAQHFTNLDHRHLPERPPDPLQTRRPGRIGSG